jgi:quercetin dioxygenase-like cupin family protein
MTLIGADPIDVRAVNERETLIAPGVSFTGTVFLDELVKAAGPSRLNATVVTFTPGARTAWHSHGFRQILFVTVGSGFVQIKAEPARALLPGAVVVIPPDVEHWHGAARDSLFTHIALLESEGAGTCWGEAVSEEDYMSVHGARV